MKALTEQQRKVYDFLVQARGYKGVPPTRGEICEHFGWVSLNAAQCHLVALEKKGWISRLSGRRARGIIIHKLTRNGNADRTPFESRPTHQFE